MKTLLTVVLCLVVGLIFGCAQQPTADSVVADVTAALGGAEKLASINDQVTTWDFTMQMAPPGAPLESAGMTTPMTITYKRPNLLRFDSIMNGQVVHSMSYDGEKQWMFQMGQTMEGNEDQNKESEFNARTWLGLNNYQENGLTLELLADETEDSTAYTVLKVTHENEFSHNLYIDKDTNMVVKSVGPMAKPEGGFTQGYMIMSDYKMVDGISLAHYVAQYTEDGTMIWEATMTEAKHNTGVEDSFFMMATEEEMSMK